MPLGPSTAPRAHEHVLPSLFGIQHSNAARATKILWSVALHGTILLLLAWLSEIAWRMSDSSHTPYRISAMVFTPSSGGGGSHSLLAPSTGVLPQSRPQPIAPPTTQTLNHPPLVPIEQSIAAPVVKAEDKPVGDPFHGVLNVPSDGPGQGGGIGQGCCGSIGNGQGSGLGDFPIAGKDGVSRPRAIYDPDPDYTDAARLQKVQGTVGLWVIISADGRVLEVHLRRGLGSGLDEKAIEAVRTWRFEPARKDGVPIAARVALDVEFRMF